MTETAQGRATSDLLLLAPQWEFVSDRVMGGVSRGSVSRETIAGHEAMRLTGEVSLENGGGFVQMAFDLPEPIAGAAAKSFQGITIAVLGNDKDYEMRLRTTALSRPWQSFRVAFKASPVWQTLYLPFNGFKPHRTEQVFEPKALRRIGILAVGRAFTADIAVASIGFYK